MTVIALASLAAPSALAEGGGEVAQSSDASSPAPAVTIPGSAEIRFRSEIAGRDLRLLVWRPEGPPPERGFPTLYAFDGDLNFNALSSVADGLAWRARRVGLAPALVVAIGYADGKLDMLRRGYDLTPPREVYDMPPRPNGKPWGEFGGGDVFLDAIEREVKPLIAARYPVDAGAETLYGHSFGGLLTLHAMVRHTDRFDRYVAASPSLWFNRGDMLAEIETFLEGRPADAPEIPLRVTVGGGEQSLTEWDQLDPKTLEMRRAWLATNAMVDHARALKSLVEAHPESGVAFAFEEFPKLDHGAASIAALHGAVSFAIRP